jgi:hypothetical protein
MPGPRLRDSWASAIRGAGQRFEMQFHTVISYYVPQWMHHDSFGLMESAGRRFRRQPDVVTAW